jgi:drug/metabolite transporter (DMT)-like permease
MKMDITIVYIFISVLLGATGQVLLKKGMLLIGPLTLSITEIGDILLRLVTNLFVMLGLGTYVVSTVIWLVALSRVDLSYAYPFVSLSYVLMLLASWLLLHENLSPIRLLGTFVIVMGVFLVSRS